jgi:uncharacterized protein (DUF697 family)
MAFPLRFSAMRALVKELSVDGGKPLVVTGARELAPVLRRELGVPASENVEGAAVLVHLLAREPTPDDEAMLKRARRARVPIVAVVMGPLADDVSIPYVLATDVVRVGAGEGFPVDRIAEAIAGRLGEDAAPLAGRVPVLRGAVAQELIESFARKNGVVGATVFIGGADLPVLLMNQIRLVLRLEQARGHSIDLRERAPELAATLGAAFGLRALSRTLVRTLPVAEWAVKGAVAYTGTRMLGQAAVLLPEAAPRRHQSAQAPIAARENP